MGKQLDGYKANVNFRKSLIANVLFRESDLLDMEDILIKAAEKDKQRDIVFAAEAEAAAIAIAKADAAAIVLANTIKSANTEMWDPLTSTERKESLNKNVADQEAALADAVAASVTAKIVVENQLQRLVAEKSNAMGSIAARLKQLPGEAYMSSQTCKKLWSDLICPIKGGIQGKDPYANGQPTIELDSEEN